MANEVKVIDGHPLKDETARNAIEQLQTALNSVNTLIEALQGNDETTATAIQGLQELSTQLQTDIEELQEKPDNVVLTDGTVPMIANLKYTDGETEYNYINEYNKNELLGDIVAGLQIDLLWENASPTSEFATQTVELDTYDDYTTFIIFVRCHNAADVMLTPVLATKECDGERLTVNYVSADPQRFYKRYITLNDGSILFGVSEYNTAGSGAVTTDNKYLLPYRILGIK